MFLFPAFRREMKNIFRISAFCCTLLINIPVPAQQNDSLREDRFSFHTQTTCIYQYKPAFRAKYSGKNSLLSTAENQMSTTLTLFTGVRLWENAAFFVCPEVAAGSGLSSSLGVGASSNGETYRVDNTAPSLELARIFYTQKIPLTNQTKRVKSDQNIVGGLSPVNYLSFTIGKVCVADYFDQNSYSHDPRTQFMSWALMSNGAWDFPANTRGYTPSVILEWVTLKNEWRYGFSLLPKEANGMEMNADIAHAGACSLEYTHRYSFSGQSGSIRIVSFLNYGNMGSYAESIQLNPRTPDIKQAEKYGRIKYGFGINGEQAFNDAIGVFYRLGWNDGHTETWAFTEIDQTASVGLSLKGTYWNRPADTFGLATVLSGISTDHRDYLKAGGYGFELGDGNLNYGAESMTELYYSFELIKDIFLSVAYQHIINPGYNKDRGPVNVFSTRVHIQL